MKTNITLLFFLCSFLSMQGQVSTKFFEKGKVFEQNTKFKKTLDTEFEKVMPTFDVTELLKEDEANKGMDIPFRFGKSFEVNLQIPANVSTLFRLKVSSPFRFKLSSGIFIKNKELHQAILVNSKINISPLLFS